MRNAVRQNKDIILTTPTSSGKSLSFNLPIFEKILRNPDETCVLYLFPLNALAKVPNLQLLLIFPKDQTEKIRKFNDLLPAENRLKIAIMTGEVSMEDRLKFVHLEVELTMICREFRESPPHIIITNPDLLHFQLAKKDYKWNNWR